jgi:mono/diheme cytochrome c family protein
MPNTRQRQVALLLVAVLAVAAVLAPRFGRAQEATPVADDTAASDQIMRGEALFNQTCIACHQAGGAGAQSDVAFTGYPALAANPLVTLEDPTVLVDTVLWGRAGMPSFRGWSDEEVADVLTYVRQAWGNAAAPVDPAIVAERRALRDVAPTDPATPFPSPPPGEDGTAGNESPVAEETVENPEEPRQTDTPEAAPTQGQ